MIADKLNCELYPHNLKVFKMTMRAFQNTNKVAIVQATGTGKGYLAGAFVKGPFSDENVLILAPNNDILINYEKNFGIKTSGRVQTMNYYKLLSVFKEKEEFLRLANSIGFLVVDEFHRIGAEKWGEATKELIRIVSERGKYVLGLSATPVRYNDMSIFKNPNFDYLSDEEKRNLKKARNMVDEAFGGNIVQGVSLEEAVYAGILPSFKYILGSFGYESAIEEARGKIEDLYESESYLRHSNKMRRVEKLMEKLETDYGDEDENLRKLVEPEVKRLSNFQKWIVFCPDVELLKDIDSRLAYWFGLEPNAYYEQKNQTIDISKLNIYQVYGSLTKEENDKNLKDFYDAKDGIHIIKCVNKLTEGAHVPNVTGIIMLRGTLSPIVYLQQIGRALSAGNRNMPIIFDFVGNIENISRVAKGESDEVNSIKKSANRVNAFNKGTESPTFFTENEIGYYRKNRVREPKIIIKDTIANISSIFSEIQDILHISSSIMWTDEQQEIIRHLYAKGGPEAVQKAFELRTFSRSIDAINAKAREMGLPKFDRKRNIMALNTDNTLEWSPEEDKMIIEAFRNERVDSYPFIAANLHAYQMANRTPAQIRNRYDHIRNGRGSVQNKNAEYPNNGKRWSEMDRKALEYSYDKFSRGEMPLTAIAYELGRSPEAILSKAQELKKYRQKRNIVGHKDWTKEEEDYLLKNYKKKPTKELCRELGVSESSLSNKYTRILSQRNAEKLSNQLNKKAVIASWSRLEDKILDDCIYRNLSWSDTCKAFEMTYRTPKEIKSQVMRYVKKFNGAYKIPESWRRDKEYIRL